MYIRIFCEKNFHISKDPFWTIQWRNIYHSKIALVFRIIVKPIFEDLQINKRTKILDFSWCQVIRNYMRAPHWDETEQQRWTILSHCKNMTKKRITKLENVTYNEDNNSWLWVSLKHKHCFRKQCHNLQFRILFCNCMVYIIS